MSSGRYFVARPTANSPSDARIGTQAEYILNPALSDCLQLFEFRRPPEDSALRRATANQQTNLAFVRIKLGAKSIHVGRIRLATRELIRDQTGNGRQKNPCGDPNYLFRVITSPQPQHKPVVFGGHCTDP